MRMGPGTRARGEEVRTGLALLAGVAAVVAATVAGWNAPLVHLVVAPPPFVRLVLAITSGLVGIALILRAAERLATDPAPPAMVRAVRLVFLAVGAFAAGAGWLLGSAVPIVAALVIGGVDVVETSFLLLVAGRAGGAER